MCEIKAKDSIPFTVTFEPPDSRNNPNIRTDNYQDCVVVFSQFREFTLPLLAIGM